MEGSPFYLISAILAGLKPLIVYFDLLEKNNYFSDSPHTSKKKVLFIIICEGEIGKICKGAILTKVSLAKC